jgi:hypothetical protein
VRQATLDTSVASPHQELKAEEASRMAVTAMAADLEYWARASSGDGHVGVNDLVRVLDTLREASVPAGGPTADPRDVRFVLPTDAAPT